MRATVWPKGGERMALSLKDLYTTLLATGVIGYIYAVMQQLHVPFVSNYRIGILLLAFAGILMCATGADPTLTGGWKTVAGGLGMLAFVLTIAGLILGTQTALYALAAVIILLWALSTARHLFGM